MTTLDSNATRLANGVADARVSCAHCGLVVPTDLVRANETHQFCCGGCRLVYRAIHDCGLEAYYDLRDAEATDGPVPMVSRGFREFDDPVFIERHVRRTPEGLATVELYLEGVHCAACVWLVEKLPHLMPAVVESRLDFGRRIVRVIWNDEELELSAIARRLASFGYRPNAIAEVSALALRRLEDRRQLVRLAIAGAIAGNVMLISFALYGGSFHGIEPQYAMLFRWVCLLLTVITLLGPGLVFFRGAISALLARTVHMDVPIAVGLFVGGLWSAAATIRGTGEVYFDSVAMLVFLLLAGRWLHTRQQHRSSDALELLHSLTPRHARRVERDAVNEVPVETLVPGDIVEVRAGDTLPVDGIVKQGTSQVNVAWLTGEARPVPIGPGDHAHAGAINIASALRIVVEATGEATRAGNLIRLVREQARRRAPIVQMADRLASVFVIVVLSLAAVTLVAWWPVNPTKAVANAIALLIITCPCALGLATPLAIVSSIASAARRNILVKGGEVLESLEGTGVVYLDKTGTLTRGRTEVIEWHGADDVKAMVASLESRSSHPTARALTDAFPGERHDVDDVNAESNGISGVVNGHELSVGSTAWIRIKGHAVPAEFEKAKRRLTDSGISPVLVAMDGKVVAIAGVGDAIQSDGPRTVERLVRLGWEVAILSGDHEAIVRTVGAAVGIAPEHCHGGLLPEDKLRFIEAARATRPVIMVGDGLNDAAALTAATVGVAVRGGAEASMASADVYLNEAGLARLPELIVGSRRTLLKIRRNLGISLGYNVIGSALAIGGLVNPLVAAILMPISSLSVIAMSYRGKTFGGPR